MWSLAVKGLLKERVRLLISIGGVAFAVALIVLLRGLFVAYETKVADYFGGIRADLWVVQGGTADFFHSFSIVSDELRREARSVPGVISARPYLARQVGFTVDGEKALVYLVGFDPNDPVTGPLAITDGTAEVGSRGIVVDKVFARKHGLWLGDELSLSGTPLQIEGISSGGDMVMFQYAYAATDVVRDILAMNDQDNSVLLEIDSQADLARVRRDIETLSPGVSIRTPGRIVEDNQQVINEGFLPVIAVLLAIGFLVGVAVIGLTIYSAVLEKRREYGMLKAVGARGRQMVGVVGAQALLSASFGYVFGVLLAIGLGRAAETWVPQFVTDIRAGDLVLVAAASVVMALLASVIPLGRIARIDPAEVFKA